MRDVISVIVPVYNVAAYLPQALDSILTQDYEKLEIILIDDGSRDDSGAICDRYAAGDPRVRVIHQKNGGAAAAKNAGLRAATGEFLSFVDSDDYLEPGVYGYMAALLKSEAADVVQFAHRDVYQNRREDRVLHTGRTQVDVRTYLKRFPSDWTCALLWNKLYRRSLFDGILFEEGHRIDDEFFTYQGIMNAKKILVDDKIIYNYRRRASSAMNAPKAGEQLMLDRVDFMLKRRDKIAARFPDLAPFYDQSLMEAFLYLSQYPDNTPATLARLKRELKKYLKNPKTTRPPKYLWLPMGKLLFTGTKKLLTHCNPRADDGDRDEYFA
ncbi:MAG: glycosyltransferase [Eubacteriales bacterium]|nr:glycosyltransferase [Eubacteriales bacterium]